MRISIIKIIISKRIWLGLSPPHLSSHFKHKEILEDKRPMNLWVQPLTEIRVYNDRVPEQVSATQVDILINILTKLNL